MRLDERVRRVEESETASQRLRDRFGLPSSSPGETEVRDWLNAAGSVPAVLACAAFAVYLVFVVAG